MSKLYLSLHMVRLQNSLAHFLSKMHFFGRYIRMSHDMPHLSFCTAGACDRYHVALWRHVLGILGIVENVKFYSMGQGGRIQL